MGTIDFLVRSVGTGALLNTINTVLHSGLSPTSRVMIIEPDDALRENMVLMSLLSPQNTLTYLNHVRKWEALRDTDIFLRTRRRKCGSLNPMSRCILIVFLEYYQQ